MRFPYKQTAKKLVLFLIMIWIASFSARSAYASIPFTTAYTTLSNSRFSFKGSLSAGITTGNAIGTIASSGFSDNNTDNLFNGDVICLNGNTGSGCIGGTTFTINNVLSSTSFAFTPTLTGSAMAGDSVVATHSGQMTITFKPTTNIASGSHLILNIASAASNYADGIPDSTGFDSAALPADLLAGVCAANACFSPTSFTASAVALSNSGSVHIVNITLSSALSNATTYSFTLGHLTTQKLQFANPTPAGTTHVRGAADVYTILIKTMDAGQTTTYDSTNMKVAPVDGVLVSANVELSITYSINDSGNGYGGPTIGASQTITQCTGTFTTSVATTATAVPFGSILNFSTFYKAAQSHYVVTNAPNGFVLTVQADGPLTSGANTIPFGTCDGGCVNQSTAAGWASAANNGFGYNLGNLTGSEAAFTGTNFKIFGTSPETIMSKASQTTASRIAMCYQLSVNATQPAGLYYDKLTYIATPRF